MNNARRWLLTGAVVAVASPLIALGAAKVAARAEPERDESKVVKVVPAATVRIPEQANPRSPFTPPGKPADRPPAQRPPSEPPGKPADRPPNR
jgi:hypothetical protein